MTDQDHKLFSTPVSVADGMKRADGRTWLILGILALAAIGIVVLIETFTEKPKLKWPQSPQPPAREQSAPEEPRTYDVAPPGSVPPPPQQ